ncbi:hypothetical protein SprV_1002916300 [Sparganum proliferum]
MGGSGKCGITNAGYHVVCRLTAVTDAQHTVETIKIETTKTITTKTLTFPTIFHILFILPIPLSILLHTPLIRRLILHRRPTRRRRRRRNRQTGRVSPLTLAAGNVRYLLDNPRCNQPERRTSLVARELARYKADIAALSEIRFSEQGQLEEVGAGYIFFWSGRPRAERRDAGVAFAIRNDIVGRLPCLPQGINDRLMSLIINMRMAV